tara:strand:- start:88 stop:480 length:393 start_codon:yes stop_codon:yes gene_type:complete
MDSLEMVATATLLVRSFPHWKCMLGQQGTGLPLLRNVMNHLPLIRNRLFKKNLLHQAELISASKPSHVKSSELNSRLIGQIAKKKKLHQAELLLASKSGGCSSAKLNSRLAIRTAQAKRLHSAQIISITK